MATMNVSMPDPMREWVQQQIEGGKYASSSDYLRDLIRRDQEQKNKLLALQLAINEGIESGISNMTMDEILKEAKKIA
ncbi:type II toxin-antitoxin system ParD family antitoxin [Thalassotalea psychrophila]|uniref:Antitoxin ParD n=1 Tax=Thalassotalea psychrophila TaxID=3065647 RepID=A0ABY9TZE5_9GAMM|nr:type II toxin-antitoxin system ParD family antitoxin [Colwelliaceae bacterium SQ149]